MEHNNTELNEMVARIGNEIKNSGADFNLDEDPFDNPGLVTMAFVNIEERDADGNTALILAAAENRVQRVKAILTMAIDRSKLWTIIDMRNNEGLNCVDMAVRAGSETCAMLITKVAREYAKHKPRPFKSTDITTEEDVLFSLDQKRVELIDDSVVKELVRQSSTASGHATAIKKLSREKISNSLSRSNAAANAGREYLKMVKRSSSAHSRLMSQRTFSVESGSIDLSEPSTPQMTQPPQDHGVLSSVGERIRSIFGKKPPLHAKTISSVCADRMSSPSTRSSSTASKHSPYHSTGAHEENHVRLPQHSTSSNDSPSSEGPSGSGMFRWGSKDKPLSTVNTANGNRLPPLTLRRRASTDARNREFSSLGDDE